MKLITIFIIICSCISTLAQQDSEIVLRTVSSGPISICNGTQEITVTITNNKALPITDVFLYTGLPDGIFYLDNSVNGMSEPADLNISNPAFELIGDSIKAGESKSITYLVRAECDLLDNLTIDPVTGKDGYVIHNTELDFKLNGLTQHIIEPNGSESYSVLSPEIQVFVPEGERHQSNYLTDRPFFRHITITNSGNGSTGSITFSISKDAGLTIGTLYLTDGTTGTDGSMEANGIIRPNATLYSIEPTLVTDNYLEYRIEDFSQIGNNDGWFDQNESIFLLDKTFVDLSGCNPSYETEYQARWGCNNTFCNELDSDAKINAYINIPTGTPNLSISWDVVQPTQLCENELIIDFINKNSGSGTLNTDLDAAFNYGMKITRSSSYFSLNVLYAKLLDVNGMNEYDLTSLIQQSGDNFYISFENYFQTDPDGSGYGLEDVDKDGYFDDLISGSQVKMQLSVDFTINSYPRNRLLENGTGYAPTLLAYNSTYHTVCRLFSTKTITNNIYYKIRIGKNSGEIIVNGPTDFQNQDTVVYEVYFSGGVDAGGTLGTSSSGVIDVSNQNISVECSVPEGLVCEKVEYNSNGNLTPLVFNQSGNILTINSSDQSNTTLIKNNSHNYLTVTFAYNCPSSTNIYNQIQWKWYYYHNNACPGQRYYMGYNNFDVYPLCGGGTMEAVDFNMIRDLYGLYPKDGTYHYYDFFGPNSLPYLTRDTCESLDLVLPEDYVEATVEGLINNAGTYDSITVTVNYKPFATNVELFNYKGGEILINNNSYSLNSISPEIINSNGRYSMIFSIPTSITGGGNFSAGTVIKFIGNFKLNYTTSGLLYDKNIISGLSGNLAITDGANKFNGNFIGERLYYKKLYSYLYGNSATYNISSGASLYGGLISRDEAFFPNEFRAVNYIKTFTGLAPNGFKFVTEGTTCQSYGYTNYSYSETPDPIQINITNEGKNITIERGSDAFVANYIQFQYVKLYIDEETFVLPPLGQTQYYKVKLSCNYSDNAYLPENEHNSKNSSRDLNINFDLNKGLELATNDIQEGFSDTIRWPIQVKAYGNTGDIPNTYIAVELRPEDQSTVLIGIEDANGITIPVTFYGEDNYYDVEGSKRYMLANIGTLVNNTQKDFYVVGRYENCIDDFTQDIDIYAGWKWDGQIDVNGRLNTILDEETFIFPIQRDILSVRYKTADMQWQINKVSAEEGNLCEPHTYDVYILSSKYADMHDLTLDINLPDGVALDTTFLQFQYPTSNAFTSVPAEAYTVNNNIVTFSVASMLGQDYLPGTRTTVNEMHLRIGFTPDCNIDPGLPIRFELQGITNCNDTIRYGDQRKIKLEGFAVDELQFPMTANPFSFFNSNSILDISISNIGEAPSSGQEMTLELPDGIELSSVISNGGLDDPEVITNPSGATLKWNLPASYLAASESKSLSLGLLRSGTIASKHFVSIKSQMTGEAICTADGSSCNLTGTTGETDIYIYDYGNQASVDIVPNTTLPICQGANLQLKTTATGIEQTSLTYTWQKDGIQIKSSTENFLEISNFDTEALGTYTVIVSDGSGKSLTRNLELKAEDIIPIHSITITGQTPTTCANGADGEVRFMINDPTGDMYTYQIIDGLNTVLHSDSVAGATEATFTQLPTGVFTLEATSPNGCISSTSFTINSGSPVLQIDCTSSLPCDIQEGEQIDLSFDFVLNRPRPLTSTSEFAFRIKDGYGNVLVIADTLAFYEEVTHVTFPYVHGQKYFLQYVELSGPCGGTGESAEYPLNFTPVNYHIVLNGEGNVFERCYEELPDNIVADLVLGRSSCSPEITGTYTVNLFKLDEETRNRIPVPCSWCDGSNQVIFPTTLAIGEYVIESSISDLFYGNCSATASFIIPEPSSLEVEITTYDVTCAGAWDGGASADVKGGFPNYEYYWYYGSELLSRDAEVTGLPAGNYFLKVQDSRGCEMLEQYNFTINDGDVMDAITVDLPTPTGTTCDVSASITGVEPGETYTFRWVRVVEEVKDPWLRMFAGDSIDSYENVSFTDDIYVEEGQTIATSLNDLNTILPGNYYITVTNSKGCVQNTLLQNLPAFNGHQLGELFEINNVEVEREYNMCFSWKTQTIEVDPDTVAVNNNNLLASITATEIAYDLMDAALECGAIAGKRAEASFEDICLNADSLKDELTIEYDVEYYHFTLYYFDRAGNLVKTVPPAGVNPLTGDQVSRMNYPDHTLLTEYNYNSLGQLVIQTTPDADTTRFIYNNAGQLRFSQNAKQAGKGTFSYSKYDAQGRVIETGQAVLNGSTYSAGEISITAENFENLKLLVPADALSYAQLPAEERFPVAAQAPTEQTFTYYSTPTAGITCNGQTQRHLLNRVSYTLHYNSNNADPAATYYSYDPHGNVEWMVQYIDGVKPKTIAYEYDLISGNVREVAYNKGEPDQFFHRYQYDEDNRIILAETSPNGVIWERDARYEYYAHGPLKRTELGEDKVQGLDYVYTLQGWLKAINHPGLDPTLDPGNDGTNTGRDVFGMILSYFDGDFVNSNPASINLAAETKPETGRSLYNGNIAAWTHATARTPGNLDYSHLNGQQFTYDVLNRIKSSKFENRSTGEYQSTYSYDPNGNLLALNRNAAGTTETEQEMDRLTYQYYDNTNRLKQVTDAVDAAKFTSDVDNQTSTENYTYDEIGNLTADEAEGIASINWTVAGKVSSITKTDGTLIRFDYDAMGNRVKKELTTIGGLVTATYYVRDASGNIMATYNETEEEIDGGIDKIAGLAEQPIYGSSRLGMQLGDPTAELQRRRVINGVAPYYIGDDNTMYHGHSHSWALIADNEATANLLTVDMSGTQPGTPQKTLYPMGPANFAPVTMAADTSGNHLFTFAVADSLNGQANVALVYDYRGLLMKETDGERPMALSKGAAITVKKPGSESNWLIITTAEEGKLLAHTVNTDSTGYGTVNEPAGEIISKNRLLATGPFLNAMAVLADHTGGTEKLLVYLLRRESSTQVSLQTWLVDENLATRMLHKTPLFSLNTWLPATIAMAGDGKHLAVVMGKGYTAPLYGLAQDGAQIRYYSINDYSRTPELVKTEPIEGELLVNSAEWDADHVTLCYATMDVFNAYKLHRSKAFGQSRYTYADVLPKPASLARGASHRVYANALGLNNLYLLDGENLTASAIGLPGTVVNGTMPYQHQLIFDKEKEEQLLYARTLGNKIYEITDHLGNVRATISDRLTVNNGVYEADLLSSSTYYPFGMTIGTLSDESDYRFGFNGMERDNEVKGFGNSYDFGARIYDTRIGNWLSIDPAFREFPSFSPYNFALNNPIFMLDGDGLKPKPNYGAYVWNSVMKFLGVKNPNWYNWNSPYFLYQNPGIADYAFKYDYFENSELNNDLPKPYDLDPSLDGKPLKLNPVIGELSNAVGTELTVAPFLGFSFEAGKVFDDKGNSQAYGAISKVVTSNPVPSIGTAATKFINTSDNPITFKDFEGYSMGLNVSYKFGSMEGGFDYDADTKEPGQNYMYFSTGASFSPIPWPIPIDVTFKYQESKLYGKPNVSSWESLEIQYEEKTDSDGSN
nr:RHS repeat-associated core domain-containing protein [uncultured Draconibacterium sp.]